MRIQLTKMRNHRALHRGLGTGTVGESGNCGYPNEPADGENSMLGESNGYADLGEFIHPNGRGDGGMGIGGCDSEAIAADEGGGGGGGMVPCGGGGGGGSCCCEGKLFQRGETRGARGENPENCF